MIMFLFYLAVLLASIYFALKILLPEMKRLPLADILEQPPQTASVAIEPPGLASFSVSVAKEQDRQEAHIEKLEALLSEKNRDISRMQTEIKALQAQTRQFDRVKGLLDDEIVRLRSQNRTLRSESSLSAVEVSLPSQQNKV